jgi:hypothetical protein
MRPKLTFANVVSVIALFVALGSGAYAAFHLKRNSVKSRNIVNGQVKKNDLAANSVDGTKVKDDSLGGNDISENSLGAVPQAVNATNATNSDKLDNLDSSAFGAVLAGNVDGLGNFGPGGSVPRFGGASGASSATTDENAVRVLSPQRTLTARDLSVKTTAAPATGNTIVVTLYSEGNPTALTCTIADGATTCHDTTHAAVIASGSHLSLFFSQFTASQPMPTLRAFVGLRLTAG